MTFGAYLRVSISGIYTDNGEYEKGVGFLLEPTGKSSGYVYGIRGKFRRRVQIPYTKKPIRTRPDRRVDTVSFGGFIR